MNVSRIIEAADGSDDDLDDVQMVDGEEGDVDSLPGLEPVDSSECGDIDDEEEDRRRRRMRLRMRNFVSILFD